MTNNKESKKEREIRLGLRPYIISDNNIIDSEISRIWVDSESFPWFGRTGFRILHNGTIYERKGGRLFGKWIIKYENRNQFDEVCVLDEGLIR